MTSPSSLAQPLWSILLALFVFGACAQVPTPRIEDAPAPRHTLERWHPPPRCDPPVELVRSGALRPYRTIATLSASCYPGAPTVCENRLLERACELEVDALILKENAAGVVPTGASTQSLVSMTGQAVRWTDSVSDRK